MQQTELKENIPDNTLKSLRAILFRELVDLRNEDKDAAHATAVSKVSSQIIASYNSEINAVKVANELKDKNITYAANLKAIQTKDTQNDKE